MREIKFRGQICQGIANAGQWVYWGISGTDLIDVIDSETIGQFTGLLDRHGVEIYEGDIPDTHRLVPVELLNSIMELAGVALVYQPFGTKDRQNFDALMAIIEEKP